MGIFTDILSAKPIEIEANTKEGLNWFKSAVKGLSNRGKVSEDILLDNAQRMSDTDTVIGDMYMFLYDAKYKDVLPYYDRFPLVLPLDFTNNGFIGLNLHYIAPRYRVVLLEQLFEYLDSDTIDSETRFRLSYGLISKVSRLKYGKPCVKRYLTSHIGRMKRVEPKHWGIVSMMPTANFGETNINTVYADSRKHF